MLAKDRVLLRFDGLDTVADVMLNNTSFINTKQGNRAENTCIRLPEDHLRGRVTPEVTRKLLYKAKYANFNAIRVWGGGYYPDDWFFDICDHILSRFPE